MTVNNGGSCSQETRNSLSQKHRRDHISDCGEVEAKLLHSRFGPALSIGAARECLGEVVMSRAKERIADEKPNKVVAPCVHAGTYVYDAAFKVFIQ